VHIQHNLPKEALYDSITSSHCVVFPSYSEGFCFAAVESIALGVPVIVSDRGALPEVVSRKHLVVTELTSDAFCDALTQAMNEAWNSTELKVFSVEDTIRGYLELFDEVL
jgi:glycosyltransferase involved in cell wall biosynthesis